MAEAGDPYAGETGEWTRQAIDVMTAWATEGQGYAFTASRVAEYADEDPYGSMKLNVGFINLSAILLLRLEQLSSEDLPTLLRKAARITL